MQVRDLLSEPKPNYERIWQLQRSLVDQIADGAAEEALLLCEHEEVLTCGRRTKSENIVDQKIPMFEIERGGDVTWHGPGQLVAYPLIRLNGSFFSGGLHAYLRALESAVIEVLKSYSLDAGRFGPTGVWIKQKSGEVKKIASIGISVRRWVTFHGLALNVSNDLSRFRSIRPCDFEPQIMTSLENEGVSVSMTVIANALSSRLQLTFSDPASHEGVADSTKIDRKSPT